MSLTLCGCLTDWVGDVNLLSCCVENRDEPPDDDFDTRMRVSAEGPWVDPQVGFITPGEVQEELQGQSDSTEAGHFLEGAQDLRGFAADFATLNRFEQRRFLDSFRVMATGLVDLTTADVNLSDEFILDAIQDVLSIEVLKEQVLQERLLQERQTSDFTSGMEGVIDDQWTGTGSVLRGKANRYPRRERRPTVLRV